MKKERRRGKKEHDVKRWTDEIKVTEERNKERKEEKLVGQVAGNKG